MIVDKFGQQIFDEKDLVEIYLKNPDQVIKNALVSEPISFDETLNLRTAPSLTLYQQPDFSVEMFDQRKQRNLFMPDHYKDMDIAKHVLDLCQNDAELQRAGQELLMYQERDLFPLLRYLKYLVDVMRANNIVWGVGRGSSVASFVLYLLGVHKINSLYYDLSIHEFLR